MNNRLKRKGSKSEVNFSDDFNHHKKNKNPKTSSHFEKLYKNDITSRK